MHGVGLLNGSVVSRLSLCGLGSVVSLLFVPWLVAARSLGSIFAAVLGSPQSRAVPFSAPRLPGEHEQVHRQSRQRPTGAHAVPVQVRLTSALRADVLRRAVSSLSRCAASLVLPSADLHVIIHGVGAHSISSEQFVSLNAQRPNPSIEGTSNIRLRLLSAAPHVKR